MDLVRSTCLVHFEIPVKSEAECLNWLLELCNLHSFKVLVL